MKTSLHNKFAALSHPNRLDIFRLLMRRFPDALPAGQIAQVLDFPASTTSTYLAALRQAGLIDQYRAGTSLQYRAALPAIRSFFDHMVSDCCQNRPDLCLAPGGLDLPLIAETGGRMNVLFVCTANAGRSLMAEAILRTAAGDRFNVFSAGTHPAPAPHADAVATLASHDIPAEGLTPKTIATFLSDQAPKMDLVITVCDMAANEDVCAWPGRPLCAHWSMEDPDAVKGNATARRNAFRHAFDLLDARIRVFAALPLERLDRVDLQHRLDDLAGLRTEIPA
ncbi:arsenate reductase/protein-tyrosine-phosphatase family protein [Chachezhania sediminis]|uniref:arsenate reductase/protein-tyrosine-phosphatase family protein n=1 Tax=Chachezhania sediminis TaxID=2599291 RepID=UPI00131CF924|nr:helix-turn-helix domain-containing protein [Chachezhania sediminis]